MKLLLSHLVAFLVVSFAGTPALGQQRAVWYAKPTPTSPCPQGVPDERCHTFSDILHNGTISEAVFSSNTILAVLGGDHLLNFQSEAFLNVRDLQNFTLLGSPEKVTGPDFIRPASRIVCVSRFAIAFINASRLSITNLTFSDCGANVTGQLAIEAFSEQTNGIHTFGPEHKVALLMLNVQTFQMVSCVVENSYGYGLLGINVLGQSAVLRSTFIRNNIYTVELDRCTRSSFNESDITACSGGNALFVYEDLKQCPPNSIQYTLQILESIFTVGVNGFGGRLPDEFLTRGAGLGIVLSQSSYGVTVIMNGIVLYGNSALIGANLYVATYEVVDNSTISLNNSRIILANGGLLSQANFFEQSGSSSGGLHFDYSITIEGNTPPVCRNKQKYQEEILRITNCVFDQNVALIGAGAFIEIRTCTKEHTARFRIENSTFSNNVGTSGTAIYVSRQESVEGTGQVMFEGVNFTTNRYVTPIRNLTELYTNFQLNAVQIIQAENVSFKNCMFSENEGSALFGFFSDIFMSNSVVFEGNNGIAGGAVNLEYSHLIFTPHTRVTFRDNYALTHGGAINAIGRSDVIFPCPFQVLDPSMLPDPNVTLHFEGNYAEQAGSVLYGGSVDRCIIITGSSLTFESPTEAFDTLVDIGPHSNDTSLISSDSTRVCYCINNVPTCDVRENEVSLPPGTTNNYPFVTVGQRGGITPSTVYITTEPHTAIGQFQQTQQTGKACTKLNITIKTTMSKTRVVVRTSNLDRSGSFMVNVELEPCPLGFILSEGGECTCDPISHLPEYTSSCNIDTQTVRREGGNWISPYFSRENGSYDGVVVFLNCPYDYCRSDGMDLDLTDPDSQCEFNRTGVLCGACKPGFSLTIGTNNCVECSNASLSLILAILVSAAALVALLFALELTVTAGTLGGVIFYANIVYSNYTIFFPPRSSSALLLVISWLNLDFASETCFYDGQDEYAKVWLGYAFPFLIWATVFIIIQVSHFSSTIARICGSRSVPVLATLLLLSYNKLLSVIILSLSSSVITYPDGSLRVVWTNDGNIESWERKHIALGAFAILIILLFIIPYTLLLVCVSLPCIQAHSSHRLLSWVNKLKPFIDAHEGPYKDRLRNWTGILLLVRIFLSILNTVNIGDYDDNVILLVIAIVMFILLAFGWVARGGMYKKWPLNILECSFFLNLGILSVATLFVRLSGDRGQYGVIQTSGTIALLELGGVITYHVYMQLFTFKRFRRWKENVLAKVKRKPKKETPPPLEPNYTTTSMKFTTLSLREPLIDEEP
jgi:predicted outer membrane repeat protein